MLFSLAADIGSLNDFPKEPAQNVHHRIAIWVLRHKEVVSLFGKSSAFLILKKSLIHMVCRWHGNHFLVGRFGRWMRQK